MSINVRTQNVTDATVQVHIAFENAGQYRRKKQYRAARQFNKAGLRAKSANELTTGRNRAVHRSSRKNKSETSEIDQVPDWAYAPHKEIQAHDR